jgi:hypothetical protein
MLTKEELNTLRENLLDSVGKMYPEGEDGPGNLLHSIALASAYVFVEGIKQYEEMKDQS